MKTAIDYWFTIEPYVFVGLTNKSVLLYNTLDKVTLESDKEDVIDLMQETLKIENCGVVLLKNEIYQQKNINNFVCELRKKYMGDIIDVNLSHGKPVQLLPYYNFLNNDKIEIYKKQSFSSYKNIFESLSEISIYVDTSTELAKLMPFIHTIIGNPTFNIIGNLGEVKKYREILSYFNQRPSPKNILCSYENVVALQPFFENNFSYRISVHFPIDMEKWYQTWQILLNQTLPIEYIFDVSSEEDSQLAEEIIEQFHIEKYRLNPIYTGDNIQFFEENVFLTKEDITSTHMTIKDFFARQAVNTYDFGKINIMTNGDAYANLNHPMLGNIYTDNIYEIVDKEIEEGNSWFCIRNQEPCNNCVYQWLCPSPSNYEIAIGRPNLCHVKNI